MARKAWTKFASVVTAMAVYFAPLDALSNPAANPASFSQTAAGAISTTVPDGTCSAAMTITGGGGGSSGTTAALGGIGAAGAIIRSTFNVLPQQAVTGAVAGGGAATSAGGTGTAVGGVGGTIVSNHRGAGGGGSTAIFVGGIKIMEAGGGGGGGAAHNPPTAGNGGTAGFAGIAPGVVAIGSNGAAGTQASGTAGGGQGGQAAAGGAGGVNTASAALNGSPGLGIGTGTGGNGGPDPDFDSAGGGGGGYTGGGGGSSSNGSTLTGAGGGGGSSFVRATSPTVSATAPIAVSGAAGTVTAPGSVSGTAGDASIDWIPCQYQLAMTKSVATSPVNAGGKVTWTVAVTNNGPDPMTRGDVLTLGDTLPAGPNGAPTPQYRVLSIGSSGGTNADMQSGALTCTGVTVGSAMPSSTVCSRPYSATAAPGAPTGGTRGLNVGETLTITYEQVISNTAACGTITNTASANDRSSKTGTTDIIGVTAARSASAPLTINCYDLAISKSATPTPVAAGEDVTWTVVVNNLGSANMMGPDDTANNPLIVTDVAPTTNVQTPLNFTSTGPAGACTYSGGTITCPSGLASGQSQTFTFTQRVNVAAPNAASIPNTASVTDPKTGDTNDSSTATTTTIGAAPALTTVKSAGTPTTALGARPTSTDAGDTIAYSYTVTNTGNVTLTGVTPVDTGPRFNSIAGTGTMTAFSPAPVTLAPGASQIFTATYTLSQADVNNAAGLANGVTNSATSRGTPPAGGTTTSPVSNASTTIANAAALSLTKAAGTPTTSLGTLTTATDAGDTIAYSYTVQNTGNVTITNAAPVDAGPQFNGVAGTGVLSAFAPSSTTLAPGATQVFTATYTLTQTDVNNGAGIANGVTNTATATGLQPNGTTTTSPASNATATIAKTSALTTTKSAGTPTASAGALSTVTDGGDTISYSYTVRNTGNVTLTGVVPTDTGPTFNGTAGTGTLSAFTPASATLAPGATQIFAATYTLSQTDVNNGAGVTNGVANTATAAGTQPGGTTTTSPPSTAQTTISDNAALTTTKNVTAPTVAAGAIATATDAGDTISYSYTVRNTGNVTLTNVAPVDAGPTFNGAASTGTLSAFTPANATLAPNATQVFTATYTLTQTDVNNGAGITNGVANTATSTGTKPGGGTVTSPSSTARTTIPETSSLTIAKSAGAPTVAAGARTTQTDGGDTITYSYTVTNTGNVTLIGVVPSDPGPTFNGAARSGTLGAYIPASATLAPGASQVFTAIYTLSQGDVNNGAGVTNGVVNTATATGNQPDGGTTTSPGSTANQTIPEVSTLAVVKSAGTPTTANGTTTTATDAGDTITYTYTVQNTGNVSLFSVVPTDAGPSFNGTAGTGTLSAYTPATATVLPGATQVFTATYTLTQADVNNAAGVTNGVTNAATAAGTQPDGGTTTAPSSSAQTTIPETSTLTVTKSAAAPTTNLGANTTLTDASDRIVYTYTVRNTGNVTLSGVVPTDVGPTFNGVARTNTMGAFSPVSASLAPGATQIFTATYILAQADINNAAGISNAVSNTAAAQGTQPDGGTTTAPTSTATTTISETATLSLVKAAGTPTINQGALVTVTDGGDRITYTYTVRNTGNVTLTGVTPVDSGPSFNGNPGTGTLAAFTPGPQTLAPNATVIFTAIYTLSQLDVNNAAGIGNAVSNTANATGTSPDTGTVTSPNATATATINKTSSLTLAKATGTPTTTAGALATRTDGGDTITYTYTIRNTGNVSLTGVVPVDAGPTFNSVAGTGTLGAFAPASATLAPNATQVFTAIYTLSQTDVNNGAGISNGVSNTATATGTQPGGTTTTAPPATAKSTIPGGSSLTINKVASLSSVSSLPATITYTITVVNTGNTSLTGISLSDVASQGAGLTLTSGPTLSSGDTNTNSILDTTETWSYSATYAVTQANINNGGNIVNLATVDTDQTTPQSSTATTTIAQTAALTIDKTVASITTANGTSTSATDGGDIITYNYLVSNTGNVTLTNVSPADAGPTFNGTAGTTALSAFTPANATILPGASQLFTATYMLSQSDVNNAAGVTNAVANTATASGFTPSAATVTSPSDTAQATIANAPSMTLVKTGTLNDGGNGRADAGDTITYAFTITNTGNTTLTGISVTDALAGAIVSGGPITLAPGANNSTSITATYTLTQADVNAGAVLNNATATGNDPRGNPVSVSNGTTVPLPDQPSLSIDKTTTSSSYQTVGDVITYSYLVTNTGNTTQPGPVTVADDVVNAAGGTVNCPVGDLQPGSTHTCNATYTITQADIDAGQVVNIASASTVTSTSPTDTVTVPAVRRTEITMAKQAVTVNFTLPGDTVTYVYVVTNTGNTTITSAITVSDNFIPSVICPPLPGGGLVPGDSITCNGTYTVTQDDLDIGSVTNIATATDGTTNSPPTSETIPANAQPALTLVKTPLTAAFAAAGDIVNYRFDVTNSGNVTLTNGINITDDKMGTFSCITGNFTPGSTQNCTRPYTITQADLDRGFVVNNAYAATTYGVLVPPTPVVSPPDDARVNAGTNPQITLTKSAITLPVTAVGQVLTYTFAVENTGNQTLTNVVITDPLIPAVNCTIPTLAVGATDNTCTGTYAVRQSDVDAGAIANTATVNATDPLGGPVMDTDTLVTNMPTAAPSLVVTKTPSLANFSAPNQVIGYTFAVQNTGNVTLSNVTVTDPLIPALSCTIVTVAPGATDNTCSGTYTTTLADVNSGSRLNTATANGTDPFATTVTDTGAAAVPANQAPSLALVKTGTLNAGVDGRADAGDTISYTFTVENTGNVTLTNVTVTDPLVTISGGPIASLAPGITDTSTFTATYTLTQADVNAGTRPNTATATGTPPSGPNVSEPDTETTPLNAAPGIALTKIGTFNDLNTNSRADAGDTISYTFTVQNTGNVTLTNVTLSDPAVSLSGGPITSLAPGATDTTTFTATHTLTQTDVDAGVYNNTASVTATPPTGPAVSDTDSVTTPLAGTPSITLTKSGTLNNGGNGRADVGDIVTYVFSVQNTGNVTLSNVTVTDPLVTVSGGPLLSLAPGATDATTFTATYTLTQADVNTGSLPNTALTTGTPPSGPDVTGPASTTTPLASSPSISLVKSATFNDGGDGRADAGDVITYAFTVTNTGNVTLTNVTVADPLVTVAGGPVASLAPGASDTTTFTASYTLTQADVNTGNVPNTATATGTPPAGPNVTGPGSTSTPLTRAPALAFTKNSTLNDGGDGRADVGDTLSYTFTVQNTGNVTLTNVSVADPLVTVSGGPIASMLPGAIDTTTFTATYTLTQNDVNNGSVVNTATVSGTPPSGPPVTTPSTNTAPLSGAPAIALVKTGTLNDGGNGRADAGDTINYTFTVRNTGNVTLTNVTVSDPLVTVTGGPIASMLPGAIDTTTFTAVYTLTQADVNAGTRLNTATVSGTPPTGPAVTASDSETTPLTSSPSMTLAKSGTLDDGGDGRADVGDTIDYTFTVTNTGNVTLTNVTINDPLVTIAGGPLATLAPGANDATTFTATYVLTQADINAGTRANTATASGNPPTGPPTTASGSDTTTLTPSSGIVLTKSGTLITGGNGRADVGDIISYTLTVRNTGNVTLTNVTVSDPQAVVTGGPLATLAPGAIDTTTFQATRVLTQANINAGTFVNTASVTGNPPTGPPATDTDTATTPLAPAPALALVKTGVLNDGGDGIANVGDIINYTFTVTNTGNVTLTNVTVADPLVTIVGGPVATLAPGAIDTTTFTATYALTLADINNGNVPNTATATGTPPTGPNVTAPGSTTTSLTPVPGITLTKSGTVVTGPDGVANVGDAVNYVFTVTNTGNVTLTNVTVTDPLVTVSGGPRASLAPGVVDATTFSATYTLTAADVNSGTVPNTATVTGTPPTGPAVTDDGSTTTPLSPAPGISLVKTGTLNAGGDGVASAGDVINYTFTVTNTGNVTLTNVVVTDPGAVVSGGPLASLAAGSADSVTFTATHVVTASEVATGSYVNTAAVSGTPPSGADVTAGDTETVPLPSAPAITLVKTGTVNTGVDGVANLGDTISYTFTVTNTGNVPLTNVTVTDPLVPVSGGPIATLVAGAVDTTTFTASYMLTAADINTGSVPNTATVSGTPPTGPAVTDDGATTTPLAAAPAIVLTKSGTLDPGANGRADAGDTVNYTFTVQNTGNVTLTNITVTDPLVTVSGGPLASLAAGATDTTTFTATYTLTAADVNAGSVPNTASVSGTPPIGPAVTDTGSTSTPLAPTPSIALTKSGTLLPGANGRADAGDTIAYTFTVQNTGNVDLANVVITDPLVTVLGGPLANLPAGATDTTTFSAIYTLTSADVNSGQVLNTASVSGTPPTGPDVTSPASATTPLSPAPAILFTKTGTMNDGGDGVANIGDTINYVFTVENIGNVTLTNVVVTDPLVTVTGGPIPTLEPGISDNSTFTATYTLTASDVNNGEVINTATATGTPPTGPAVTDDDTATTSLVPTPSITLIKTGTLNDGGDGVADIGDTINYSFIVENTGNVTLSNVTLADPLVTVSGGPIASLPAGGVDTLTFTASYTLTAADLNVGSRANTATVTGTPPVGPSVSDTSTATTPLASAPAIVLTKSGTLNPGANGRADAGDTITYNFTVQNTGNVALTNVVVTDPLVIVSGGPLASLAAGATDTTTFSASYVLTAADVNSGQLLNTASVSGTPPTGPDVTDAASTTTPIAPAPAIQLTKMGTLNTGPDGTADVGDTISYLFTVENTGNVTLTNIVVTDPLVTVSGGPLASLAAGATNSTTFTATYTLTTTDVNNGQVLNTASVSGTPPTGPDVTDPASATTTLTAAPSIAIVKFSTFNDGGDGVANIGDIISYTFTVQNTGNVSLSNVTVNDPLVTVSGGPIPSLAAGAVDTTTFTANYALTAADLVAGRVSNRATATGTPPSGPNVSDFSDELNPGSGAGADDPTITLLPVNPPVASNDSALNNPAGSVVTLNTLSNDSAAPGRTLDPASVQIVGTATPGTALVVPGEGTWSVNTTTGAITFTPEAGYTGNPTVISYTVADDQGNRSNPATQTVTYTVAPVAVADSLLNNPTGTAVTLPTLSNDTTSTGRTLNPASVQIVGTATPGTALVVPGEGTWSVNTTTGAITFTPEAGYTGNPTVISYTVADDQGNRSNPATQTVTYTVAPVAVADSLLNNPAGTAVTLPTLSNDTTSTGRTLNPASVQIVGTAAPGSSLVVPGEGTWSVNTTTGAITFTPEAGYTGNPTVISYTVADDQGNRSNPATQTVTYLPSAVATLSGKVFIDTNKNGVFDTGERTAGAGYIVEVTDSAGVLLGTATTNAAGLYSVNVPPGTNYTITFKVPTGGVIGQLTNVNVPPGSTVVDQNQPIDPSGVVYDSVTRLPVAGATVRLTDAAGNPLPAACFADPSQQNQVTGPTGAYRFDIVPGGNAACAAAPTTYLIEIIPPAGYRPGFSTTLPPQPGSLNVVPNCAGDAVAGGLCEVAGSGAPPAVGTPARYFVSFIIGPGSPDLVNNHLPIDPIVVLPAATFSKTANVGTVRRGETVTYTLAATNVAINPARFVDILPPGFDYVPGSARANGAAVTPSVVGNRLTFDGLAPNASNAITLTLKLVANAAVTTGDHVNRAQFVDPATGVVIATARATVSVLPEHVFDCSDIIGKVFDDINRNGVQDAETSPYTPEPGLAGARLVTVNGKLITTDKNGRFHVGCADMPDADIGSNFVLKLDTRSLPTGYRVTTENPRSVRLTRGKVTKLNFGASIGRVVRFDLTDKVFEQGSITISPKLAGAVTKLISLLENEPSSLRLTYFEGADGSELARKRMATVRAMLVREWKSRRGRYKLPIEARIVGKK